MLALVAHDAKKGALISCASAQRDVLAAFAIVATGTTGGRLIAEVELQARCLKSGPLGGDAQLGAMIAEGQLAGLIFFIDPLSALPHDVDVKSLLRLAILYNTPLGVNEATASAVLHSLQNAGGPQ